MIRNINSITERKTYIKDKNTWGHTAGRIFQAEIIDRKDKMQSHQKKCIGSTSTKEMMN